MKLPIELMEYIAIYAEASTLRSIRLLCKDYRNIGLKITGLGELIFCARKNLHERLEFLLSKKYIPISDPRHYDKLSVVIDTAATHGNIESMRLLLKDDRIRKNGLYNAITNAAGYGNIDVLKLLIKEPSVKYIPYLAILLSMPHIKKIIRRCGKPVR